MKKFLVIFALSLAGILFISACETQHKCAAYGYYSEYNVSPTDNSQL